MAGIGEAASIIAVIQVADRLLCLYSKYASAVEDAKTDLERLTSGVDALQKGLKSVENQSIRDLLSAATLQTV